MYMPMLMIKIDGCSDVRWPQSAGQVKWALKIKYKPLNWKVLIGLTTSGPGFRGLPHNSGIFCDTLRSSCTAQYIYVKLHFADKNLSTCETKLELNTSMPCEKLVLGTYSTETQNRPLWCLSVLQQWLWPWRGFRKHLWVWSLCNTRDNKR